MNSSNDQAAKEIEFEEAAELKLLFPALRKFFEGNSEHMPLIREKYGAFPQSWQDLKTWEFYKPLRKRYLAFTDGVTLPFEESPANTVATNPVVEEVDSTSITIGNLSESETQSKMFIQQVFSCFGTILSISFKIEPEGTHSAHVRFGSSSSAMQALELNGMKLGAREVVITLGGSSDPSTLSAGATAPTGTTETTKPKRSRWGEPTKDTEGNGSSKRRNRWGESSSTSLVTTGSKALTPSNNSLLHRLGLAKTLTQEEEQEAMLLKMKIQKAVENCQPERILLDSLSLPEVAPQYDAFTGLRKNTPESRMREQRIIERDTLIEKMFTIDPLYNPPPGYVRRKPTAKLYIPAKEYPTYNFVGLVIGPRGNTQKMMEKESRCKICIRGKGSAKEGSKRGPNEDENDDLHVYIAGDTQADVDKAVAMVKPLLVPVNDDTNEHKQAQLRELALINGTVKPEDFCPLCGEQGHRQFECPTRRETVNNANVRCKFCGETSHPARDCPVEKERKAAAGEVDKVVLDDEYHSFLAELNNKTDAPAPAATPNPTNQEAPPAQPQQAAPVAQAAGVMDPAHAQYYAYQQQLYMQQSYAAHGMLYDPTIGWYYPYQYQQPQQPQEHQEQPKGQEHPPSAEPSS